MQPYEYIRQGNACLMYYAGIDGDTLSDEVWCMKIKELEWIRKLEAKVKNDGQSF